jgi:hypothetical protein
VEDDVVREQRHGGSDVARLDGGAEGVHVLLQHVWHVAGHSAVRRGVRGVKTR